MSKKTVTCKNWENLQDLGENAVFHHSTHTHVLIQLQAPLDHANSVSSKHGLSVHPVQSRGLWEDTWQPLILLTPSPPRSKASLKLVIVHSGVNEFSSQGCSLTATWLRELLIEKESVSGALVQPICL